MSELSHQAGIARVFWIAIALAGIAAALAVITARDLVYDGSYYLLGIAAHGKFQLYEPARRTIEFLQQCFAVAGEHLGIRSLWALGQLFSLGCSGWPVALTSICWFVLPAEQKSWIVCPLANLVFAIPTASFIGVSETIIASCVLWVTFFLVAFRLGSPWGALACVLSAAACVFSHESGVIFLGLIAALAARRLKTTRGVTRPATLAVIALSAGGAFYMLRWIFIPRSAIERGDFLTSLMGGFLGSPFAPNIPALASIAAGLAILVALTAPKRIGVAAAWISIAIFVCALIVLLFLPDQTIVPSRFFAARGLPLAVSTALAAGFLLLGKRNTSPERFATTPVLAIVLGLAAFQFPAQIILTEQWASYARDLSGLVASRSGGISHADAIQALDSGGTRLRRELLESWSVEPLSVMLAPQGHVRAVVLAAPWARWAPYRLDEPATLPRTPELDWSRF